MRILQLSTFDINGGAEAVALSLHQAYLEAGHEAHLLVASRRSSETGVSSMLGEGLTAKTLTRITHRLELYTGTQGVFSPYLRLWSKRQTTKWDIVHCHNLHSAGGYVSFRDLAMLAPGVPMVLTLHDLWMLTGHCAHPCDCEKFQHGCGGCPDLDSYIGVRIDRTCQNARRKREFVRCRQPRLVGVSRWVAEKVRQSHLGCECEVVYNGINTEQFRLIPKAEARARLGISTEANVLVYVSGQGLRETGNGDSYKRPSMILNALRILRTRIGSKRLKLIVVGSKGFVPPDLAGIVLQAGIVRVGLENYYAAADVALHASRAETFCLVIAEALACGTPVVSTNTGACSEILGDERTGYLVPLNDANAMADKIERLLSLSDQRRSEVCRARVLGLFSLETMVSNYLRLYERLCQESGP